jgi:DNA-binding transcriptional LysR family regulator
MELTQLQYFYTVAQTQNITAAAELLHIAQPTLSKVIKRLEDDLGMQLFDRKASKLTLNPLGEAYLVYVEKALDALERGQQHLENMRTGLASGIRLASTFDGVPNMLMEQFALGHPDLTVTEVRADPEEIASLLLNDHIDFALTLCPLEQMELENMTCVTEPLLLKLPACLEPGPGPVRLGDYQHQPFALFEGGKDSYATFLRCCNLAGFVPTIAYRSTRTQRVYELSNRLNVCTLMPAHMTLSSWDRLADEDRRRMLMVDEPRCNRRIHLYRRQKEQHPESIMEFSQFAVHFFQNMNADIARYVSQYFPEEVVYPQSS